ncbi:hypothetical protein AMJ40_02075 [candidate division TA06 bacterium DG_26]|uniref:PDZ domain-containing protein n=1 Tax=candidate division TA06 bacterium DG_26 TaxID=1703771 RepID=A0A0S7WKP5_UNCT6|nr:MAG: hypothetical protein AMJ40_02075 [candidate division TA06 bacterium DG_26]
MTYRRIILSAVYLGSALFLLTCDWNVPQGSKAQPAQKSEIFAGEQSPFVNIAEQVLPSVVNISAEKVVEERRRFEFEYPFRDLFKDFEKFFKELPPSFRGKETNLGSGFVMSEDGYIVTNNHVISGAEKIVVTMYDKTVYRGDDVEIVGWDTRTDLAVLRVHSEKKLQPVKLGDSDEIRIGDWAIAIGNPLGFRGSVTVGVISAKGRSGLSLPEGPTQQDFLQTDAAIHPGNSGGPLLNIKGEVIGINTAIATRTGYWQGIGFAIPVSIAKNVYQQLIEKGKVVRGWLGVYIQELTGDLIEALQVKEGVLVTEVMTESPAEKGKMEAGDVIVEFNGKKIESIPQLQGAVSETSPGEVADVVVIRDGKEKKLRVEVGEMPDEVAFEDIEEEGKERGWLGLIVAALDSEKARDFDVEVEEGVLVVEVELASPADEAGIMSGDVILEIEKRKVKDLNAYEKISSDLENEEGPFLLLIQRGSRKRFVAVTPE